MPTFTMLARSLGRKASAPAPSWPGQSTTLVPGAVGSFYNQQVVAVPTFGTVTYSKVGDSPAWVLVSSSGALTGSPGWVGTTLTQATSQTMSIVVRALDQQGLYTDVTLSVTISSTIPVSLRGQYTYGPGTAGFGGGALAWRYNGFGILENGGYGVPIFKGRSYTLDMTWSSDSGGLTFTPITTSPNGTLSTIDSQKCRLSGTAPTSAGISYISNFFQYRIQDQEFQYALYDTPIELRTPSPKHVSSYTLKSAGWPSIEINPAEWYVEGSNDMLTWVQMDYRNIYWGDYNPRTFTCQNPGSYPAIRMRIIRAVGTGYNIFLQEIEYNGNNGTLPPSGLSSYPGALSNFSGTMYSATGVSGQNSTHAWMLYDKNANSSFIGGGNTYSTTLLMYLATEP